MDKVRARGRLSEIMLVVVSVLIAFALDSWWERRQLHSSELDHLVSIRPEFAEAVVRLDSLAESADRNVRSLATLAGLLSPERPPPPVDSVLAAAAPLWFWQLFDNDMPAYAEFLGGIGLSGVTDPELRKALYQYESALEQYEGWEDYMTTAQVNLWKPAFLDLMPSPFLGTVVGPFDLRGLASDRAFLNTVGERRQVESGLLASRRELSTSAREVVNRLDLALAR